MPAKRNKKRLYRRVFRILGKTTPLRADCGVLCERRCCKGDSGTGMLLFPEEQSTFRVQSNGKRRLAVCGGSCKRNARPLSCRLFPLLPEQSEDGRIKVHIDRRGAGICPLAAHENKVRFSERFLHRVKKAGKLLYADADCRRFLEECLAEGQQKAELLETFLKK